LRAGSPISMVTSMVNSDEYWPTPEVLKKSNPGEAASTHSGVVI